MKVARIIYPIKVLGPGERIGVWFAGCPHKCYGCSNPELWDSETVPNVSVDDVFLAILKASGTQIIGITITGGEPFAQIDELCDLVGKLRRFTDDILIYTGYTLTELLKAKNNKTMNVLDSIAVLIDGKYINSENDCEPLIGSRNQNIHYFKESIKSVYTDYISQMRERKYIQNFSSDKNVISVGIHSSGFDKDFDYNMRESYHFL